MNHSETPQPNKKNAIAPERVAALLERRPDLRDTTILAVGVDEALRWSA